ncbi:MAG TPA: hypothetical protein VMM58_01940 [Bacteroidota bacterium]|nr:hypothetical protein [Bacteroidota bacterium]
MFIVSLLFIALPLFSTVVPVADQGEVKCDIALEKKIMKPGATGEVLVTFAPDEGIHINTDPAMEFEFTKTPMIHLNGVVSLPKQPKTGYLDTRRPVRYSFTLDKKIPKGAYTLKGTVQYFFCSDAEGWCSRSSHPIELTFTVAP